MVIEAGIPWAHFKKGHLKSSASSYCKIIMNWLQNGCLNALLSLAPSSLSDIGYKICLGKIRVQLNTISRGSSASIQNDTSSEHR